MIVFLLLCVASVLPGVGVLTALGLRLDRTPLWLLGPGALLSCWAIGLGVGVALGVPVGRLAIPLWAATTAAAIFGAWHTRLRISREAAGALLFAAIVAMAVMAPDFWQGPHNFIGGPAGDGWSYVAFGQYLWEMPKGTQGHLPPLYQYACHLSRARFIASALLGVISPLTGEMGDTQAAAGYFVAWSLFIFGASCAFVAVTTGLRHLWLLAFCALAVASRWVTGAVEIHNYDNLLAISFLPMVMGLITGLPRPDWRGAVALGSLVAAAVYVYPEMAVFILVGGALTLTNRMLTSTMAPTTWITMAAAGGSVALLALFPAASDLLWFISNQLNTATAAAGARAGEGLFSELLRLPDWGASVWGFASSAAELRAGSTWQLIRQSFGLAMWAVTLAGLVRAVRTRQWDIAMLAIALMICALVMIVRAQYLYGAYKFILLGWWSLMWLAVAGAQDIVTRTALPNRFPSPALLRSSSAVAIVLVWTGLVASTAGRVVVSHRSLASTSVEPYRQVLAVQRFIGDTPIVVDVNDTLANQWAVYFLRGHSMLLLAHRGYMAFPHVVPFMEQSAPVDVLAARYVLSDQPTSEHEVVWKQPPYVLWRIPPTGAAFIRRIVNRNGLEQMNGQLFFWIGQGDTELDILATSAGEATLSGRFVPGPNLPDAGTGRLLVGSNRGSGTIFAVTQQAIQSFTVTVGRGTNTLYIRALDSPVAPAPNARDPRPLMVGLEGLRVSMRGS